MQNSLLKDHKIAEVDQLRVNLYRLLARCLSAPADAEFLSILKDLQGDAHELGVALSELAAIAGRTSAEAAREEYQDLFIGVGRGELLPYCSYYLTGFLNEKPLARLRNDMGALGIERDPGLTEPEDHAGAIMEMMAGLIDGSFGTVQPTSVQHDFFKKHMASWLPHFFRDLQAAKHADLFKPVGKIGALFMAIEESAFAM